MSLQLLAAAVRAMASLASQQPAHCAALVAAGPGLDAILSVLRSTDFTHDDWGNAALVVACVACSLRPWWACAHRTLWHRLLVRYFVTAE